MEPLFLRLHPAKSAFQQIISAPNAELPPHVLNRVNHLILPNQRSGRFPNTRSNGFDGLSGVDDSNSFRLKGGNGLVAFLDPLEEMAVGLLHAIPNRGVKLERNIDCSLVLFLRGSEQARLSIQAACFADGNWNHKQQSQIRTRLANGKVDDGLDELEVELASISLIGHGRIMESIRQNDLPRLQGRPDYLPHQLRPTGVHEEQ